MQKVKIYTDGGSKGNPGPGGYGVVLLYGEHRRELSGGFRQTTNNRMELLAAIEGLGALKRACEVTLYSDSRYVVDGMTKGWARRWRANGWRRNRAGDQALNADLWGRLLEVAERHRVTFEWVRGHAGNEHNERCDELASAAAIDGDLDVDGVYEASAGSASAP
ncbi:MAG: ribonuclease HI [Acidobacteriota bacterium]